MKEKTNRQLINEVRKELTAQAAKLNAAPSCHAVNYDSFCRIAIEEAYKCAASRQAIINRLINKHYEEQR